MALISVHMCKSKPLVWNADDATILREKYRIVGVLVGCFAKKPMQNNHLGLPLQLMSEEVSLLISKGIIKLLVDKPKAPPTPDEIKKFKSMRDTLYKDQIEVFRRKRLDEINSHKDEILLGGAKRKERKRKRLEKNQALGYADVKDTNPRLMDTAMPSTIDAKDTEDDDLVKKQKQIPVLPRRNCLIQIPLRKPTPSGNETSEEYSWNYPETPAEQLRCRVFADLWERGLYLTPGGNFGGDFLAYPGDPGRYHSFYIVICKAYHQKCSALDISSMSRISTVVKKTILIASISDDDQLEYTSLKWTGLS